MKKRKPFLTVLLALALGGGIIIAGCEDVAGGSSTVWNGTNNPNTVNPPPEPPVVEEDRDIITIEGGATNISPGRWESWWKATGKNTLILDGTVTALGMEGGSYAVPSNGILQIKGELSLNAGDVILNAANGEILLHPSAEIKDATNGDVIFVEDDAVKAIVSAAVTGTITVGIKWDTRKTLDDLGSSAYITAWTIDSPEDLELLSDTYTLYAGRISVTTDSLDLTGKNFVLLEDNLAPEYAKGALVIDRSRVTITGGAATIPTLDLKGNDVTLKSVTGITSITSSQGSAKLHIPNTASLTLNVEAGKDIDLSIIPPDTPAPLSLTLAKLDGSGTLNVLDPVSTVAVTTGNGNIVFEGTKADTSLGITYDTSNPFTGSTTFESPVKFDSAATFAGAVAFAKAVEFKSTATFGGAASFATPVDFPANTEFKGSVVFEKAVAFADTASFAKSAEFKGKLTPASAKALTFSNTGDDAVTIAALDGTVTNPAFTGTGSVTVRSYNPASATAPTSITLSLASAVAVKLPGFAITDKDFTIDSASGATNTVTFTSKLSVGQAGNTLQKSGAGTLSLVLDDGATVSVPDGIDIDNSKLTVSPGKDLVITGIGTVDGTVKVGGRSLTPGIFKGVELAATTGVATFTGDATFTKAVALINGDTFQGNITFNEHVTIPLNATINGGAKDKALVLSLAKGKGIYDGTGATNPLVRAGEDGLKLTLAEGASFKTESGNILSLSATGDTSGEIAAGELIVINPAVLTLGKNLSVVKSGKLTLRKADLSIASGSVLKAGNTSIKTSTGGAWESDDSVTIEVNKISGTGKFTGDDDAVITVDPDTLSVSSLTIDGVNIALGGGTSSSVVLTAAEKKSVTLTLTGGAKISGLTGVDGEGKVYPLADNFAGEDITPVNIVAVDGSTGISPENLIRQGNTAIAGSITIVGEDLSGTTLAIDKATVADADGQ